MGLILTAAGINVGQGNDQILPQWSLPTSNIWDFCHHEMWGYVGYASQWFQEMPARANCTWFTIDSPLTCALATGSLWRKSVKTIPCRSIQWQYLFCSRQLMPSYGQTLMISGLQVWVNSIVSHRQVAMITAKITAARRLQSTKKTFGETGKQTPTTRSRCGS